MSRQHLKYLLLLLITFLVLLISGTLLIKSEILDIDQKTFGLLLSLMTLINISLYLLISIGSRKKESVRGMYLLAGIGGKFLLYLLLILGFWLDGKNLTKDFIIAFFVLYLLLTIFLVSTLLKVLNKN